MSQPLLSYPDQPFPGGPPGYPPPGQYPPGGYPPPRTSAAAVTGFVLSLLLCLPVVGSVAGLALGIVGLRATGRPNVRGRGLAVAAVVLGSVGLLGWAAAGLIAPSFMAGFRPGYFSTTEGPAFARALAAGDTAAAAAKCVPGTTPADLQPISDQLATLGPLQSVHASGFHFVPAGQTRTSTIGLLLNYLSASKALRLDFQTQPDGSVRISHWTLN